MSTVVLNPVTVCDSPAPSDADLVERFLSARDQTAFTELVHRHSRIVLGVCRRTLSDSNDIDDVFQATFLVLVRDSARVRKRASLASWLYGVAYRLSLRVARTKQLRRETGLVDQTTNEIGLFESLAGQHDRQSLDDELNALPERYRQVLVLRYLMEKSTSEIASELGTTIGSVEGNLKRGKELLGSRLLKRGVNLGVALIAIQCSQQAVDASVPSTLIETTIKAGLAWDITTNTLPVDLVNAQTAELLTKEIIAMTATTKTTLAVGLTVGGLLAGMGGINLMNGPGKGNAEAAGIHSTLSTISAVNHEIEMAAFAAEPVGLKAEVQPDPTIDKPNLPLRISTPIKPTIATTDSPPVASKWHYRNISTTAQRIEKELQTVSEVDFEGVTLREAIGYLKSTHAIEILVDRIALRDEGKTEDIQMGLRLAGVPLKSILKLLLEPEKLTYVIENDILTITTATRADSTYETRVYDFRRTGVKSPESLVKAIESTIQGEHVKWSSKDNAGGVIQSLESALVISQTQRVHEEIVDLLEQLERHNESKQQQK